MRIRSTSSQATPCLRIVADIRRHLVPIVVAVIAGRLLDHIGFVATAIIVIVCIGWVAWLTGWRVEFTPGGCRTLNNSSNDKEEQSHGTEHHTAAQ